MSYADIDLATVPAAPPARKNQRATSWPAPISAIVPYQRRARLICRAFCRVSVPASMRAPSTVPQAGGSVSASSGPVLVNRPVRALPSAPQAEECTVRRHGPGERAETPLRFPRATLDFLTDLRANNSREWFDANRARYERDLVAPAKAFVTAAAPLLDRLAPGISAEPRVLGSIFRINRDTRFSPDKRPYKAHLDLWFWHGRRSDAASGLFLRLTPDELSVGAG